MASRVRSLSSPLSPTVNLSAVPVGVITGTPCLTASAIKPSVAPEVTAPTTTSTTVPSATPTNTPTVSPTATPVANGTVPSREEYKETFKTSFDSSQGYETATAKNRLIYDYYLEGRAAKEILVLLDIKENTLKYHNKNIYSKLGVSSRKQMIELACFMKKLNF